MLEARAIVKRYKSIPVVNNVSFVARPSEVVGYLGANGAGKSTTVKILTGLVQPSSGEVWFEGKAINDQLLEYKERLGYVPEEPHLYPYLTGKEYLQLIGRLRCMPEKLLGQKIDEFMQLFSLRPHRYSPLSSYSKGMRQKILISAALLHNPDVLILDEPLSGLDVTSSLIIRSLIKSLAGEGRIVLLSSHLLETVEKLCSRVIILHRGSIVANDSVERLRNLMELPSLEEIFSELVIVEDTDKIARDIVDVMKAGY